MNDDWGSRLGIACTWVRTNDGARCVLDPDWHWPHLTEDGVVFPEPPRTFRGRVMRVA